VSGSHLGPDQFFFLLEILFRQLRVCYFVAPSLTGGRVCNFEVGVEVNLRPTVSWPVCLVVRHPSGTRDQFFFLLEIFFRQLQVCYFVAPSLTRWRVCNLLYNCFWALPEQSLLGRSPAELTAIFYSLIFKVLVKVMLRLMVSHSVCLGVKFTLELVTRYNFLSESCCVELSLSYSRRSVDQFVLVSDCPSGPMTRFYPYPFFSDKCFVVLPVGRPLWREDWSEPYSAIADWSGHLVPTTIHYLRIWDCIPASSPLTTRRDYGGGILTHLHTGKMLCRSGSHITTDSLPVRLGALPLLEQVTRCYIYLSGNYFLYF
jgi:hypothetical protein